MNIFKKIFIQTKNSFIRKLNFIKNTHYEKHAFNRT